ncbi:MAG: trypsin-like serine protease [Myxococcota bacterium]
MFAVLLTTALGAPRIGDGVPADDLPEVVAFSSPYLTTGVLIHPQVVLTHAHLFDNDDLSTAPPGAGARVFLGGDMAQPGTEVPATAVAVYPEYQSIGPSPNAVSQSDGPARNDIALVWLAEPVALPVMALNETPLTSDWRDVTADIAGFGAFGTNNGGQGIRRVGRTRIDELDDDAVYLFDPDGQFACTSDAGGPVIRYRGDQPVALGITWSYGQFPCGVTPSTHGRVDAYVDWIRTTLAPLEIETVALELPSLQCTSLPRDPSGQLVLDCEVTVFDGAPIAQVEWSWGDGSTDTTTDASNAHAYGASDTFAVAACVTSVHRGREYVACVETEQLVVPVVEEVEAGGCGCAHFGGASMGWLLAGFLPLLARR